MAMRMGTSITTTTILTTITSTIMTDALFRLMTWLSPAYPVGGFSYSHGLEAAVEAGLVRDRAGLIEWLSRVLRHGSGLIDAVALASAWRAGDDAALDVIADLAAALKGSAELALESELQGAAFAKITMAAWPSDTLARFVERRAGKAMPHAVTVAIACAPEIPVAQAVTAYLQAFTANLVSAAVRLVPLGQTDGQLALAALAPVVAELAALAQTQYLDDIATAAPMVDILSMIHETQYTRLFRS
jgi:urease accessory protein